MKQNPSIWRFIRTIWLQNFKQNPIATVGSTAVVSFLFVGLIFVSAFFAVGFLVLAGVLLITNRLFGFTARRSVHTQHSQSQPHQTHRVDNQVIEGDYEVVEKEPSNQAKNDHQK